MGGLAVLFLMGLYIALTLVAVAKVKPIWGKALVLLAALLIPTADAVYGRVKLKQMCATEGGLKIYRVAEHVKGFLADSTDEAMLKKYGFEFTEGESSAGKYYRFQNQNGRVLVEENIAPKSQYRIRLERTGDTKNRYMRNQYIVSVISTGEVLATDTQIAFNGGWAERFLARFSDAGGGSVAWCTNTELDVLKRIDRVINAALSH